MVTKGRYFLLKRNIAFVTIVLTYFLIVFGGYVASSESGMGCGPEWPLCNGKVIPELHGETLIEFGHRFIGAILFLFTVILFFKVKKESSSRFSKTIANWMLGLFILQLIAGAIVVFYHLPPIIITIHLLIAIVYLGILIWFWRHPTEGMAQMNEPSIKKHLSLLSLLIFVTIGFGAYVKHKYYGLACGYLSCGDTFFPTTIPELLQTAHRLLAVLSVVYILFMIFNVTNNKLKGRMYLAFFVILLQFIIGMMTILSFVSISYAVLHLAAATLLFAIIIEARISMG